MAKYAKTDIRDIHECLMNIHDSFRTNGLYPDYSDKSTKPDTITTGPFNNFMGATSNFLGIPDPTKEEKPQEKAKSVEKIDKLLQTTDIDSSTKKEIQDQSQIQEKQILELKNKLEQTQLEKNKQEQEVIKPTDKLEKDNTSRKTPYTSSELTDNFYKKPWLADKLQQIDTNIQPNFSTNDSNKSDNTSNDKSANNTSEISIGSQTPFQRYKYLTSGSKDKLNIGGLAQSAESSARKIVTYIKNELNDTSNKKKLLTDSLKILFKKKNISLSNIDKNTVDDLLPNLQALAYLFQAGRGDGPTDIKEGVFEKATKDNSITKDIIKQTERALDVIKQEQEINSKQPRKF